MTGGSGRAVVIGLVLAVGGLLLAGRVLLDRGDGPRPSPGGGGAHRGELLFGYCAPCHGADGRGRPGQGPSLADSPVVRGPLAELVRTVVRGPARPVSGRYVRPMPGFDRFSDGDLALLLDHLRRRIAGLAEGVSIAALRRARRGGSSAAPEREEKPAVARPAGKR